MIELLFQWAKKQGPTLTLMGVAIWYFYGQTKELEQKIDSCQGQQIELLRTTVKENTEAFKAFREDLSSSRDRYREEFSNR